MKIAYRRWPAAVLPLLLAASAGWLRLERPQQPQQPQQPIDSTWLTFDRSAKTVRFQLIAAYTGLNGGLNFNGFRDGDLTVVVPAGWAMRVDFYNHDGVLPHSAEVIKAELPVPPGPVNAAIPGAVTLDLGPGIVSEGRDDMRFVAAPAGEYLLFCAVAGHGLAGMWIRLRISPDAAAPALLRTPVKRP